MHHIPIRLERQCPIGNGAHGADSALTLALLLAGARGRPDQAAAALAEAPRRFEEKGNLVSAERVGATLAEPGGGAQIGTGRNAYPSELVVRSGRSRTVRSTTVVRVVTVGLSMRRRPTAAESSCGEPTRSFTR